MNRQGKSVGPYTLWCWWFGNTGWTPAEGGRTYPRLRGSGGVVEAAKYRLRTGARVAMIVDGDGDVTHMEYWGLAQPRTMKLVHGSFDWYEAQDVYVKALLGYREPGEES